MAGLANREPAAALDAGRSHHPIFVDPLRALLRDPDSAVRTAAATALGEIGVPRASHDLNALIRSLEKAARGEDDRVAQAALHALARYPFPYVRARLTAVASDNRLGQARRLVARNALHRPIDGQARERMEAWLQTSQRESALARTSVAMGAMVDSATTRWGVSQDSLLLAARDLLDPDGGDRQDAVERIARWPNSVEGRPFLVKALGEAAAGPRRTAARALAANHDRVLVAALSDKDDIVRSHAIHGVGSSTDPAVTVALTDAILRETSAQVLALLRQTLAAHPVGLVLRNVAAWPTTLDEPHELEAIAVASSTISTTAVDVLVVRLMEASTERSATGAAEAVRAQRSEDVVPRVLARVPGTDRGSVKRRRLLEALTGRTDPRIAPALLALLADGAAGRFVLQHLSAAPERSVRPGLLVLIAHHDRTDARALLDAATAYRGEDVVEALVARLQQFPRDEHAFELLDTQDRNLTFEPYLDMLADPRHSDRHYDILLAIEGRRDARLPTPIAAATLGQPDLAQLGLRALANQDADAAIPALATLAEASQLDPSVRTGAIDVLKQHDLAKVETLLLRLAKDDVLDVRMKARNTLHDLAPERFPAWDPYGRIPLIVESSAFGGVMMLLAADIADAELSRAFTGGVGVVLGGATSFLLTMSEDVTLGDAAYFGTTSTWGTLGGWGLGASLGLSDDNTRWLTLGGETLGVAAGALLMKRAQWSLDDAGLTNMSALEAAFAAAAARSLFIDEESSVSARSVATAGMVGGALATIGVGLFARQIQVEDRLGTLATTMGHGALLGASLGGIVSEDLTPGRVAAGAVLGQSLGYFAGMTWAQFDEISPRAAGLSFLGAATAGSAFGGLGLMIDDLDPRGRYAMAQGGAAAGAIAFGLWAEHLEMHDNDFAIVALSTAGGALALSRLSVRLEEKTFGEPSFPGGILLGAGAGLATGLALSQLLDLEDRQLHRILGGTAAFAAGGVGLGYLIPNLDVRQRSNVSGAAIVLGLGLTAPFAHLLEIDDADIAYIALGAAAGAAWGGTLASYRQSPTTGAHAGGAMFGASLGLASAVATSQLVDLHGRHVALASVATAAGTSMGAGLGLLVPTFDRRTTAGLTQGLGLSALVASTAIAASLVSDGTPQDHLLIPYTTALTAHGAAFGVGIPFVWRDDAVPGSEVAGGALAGAGLGAMTGLLTARLTDDLEGTDLLEASAMASLWMSAGIGVGAAARNRRLGGALFEGLGAAGYATALALAPATTFSLGDTPTMLFGALELGWLGGWIPHLVDDDVTSTQTLGAAYAGGALGVLGAAALVQARAERDDIEVLSTTIVGSGLGAGIGLMLPAVSDRGTIALMEGLGATGLAVGLVLSPYTAHDADDWALGAVTTALGSWHGAWLPLLFDENTIGGGVMFGASVGAISAMTASQLSDVTADEAFEILLLGGAASGAGAGLGLLVAADDRSTRAALLEAVGLTGIVAASLIAPRTSYEPRDAGLISLATAAGAWTGFALAPRDRDETRAGATVFGASLGALAGVTASQLAPLDLGDQFEAATYTAAGNAIGGGLAALIDADESATRLAFGIAGVSGLAAGFGAARFTTYSSNDRAFSAVVGTLGVWHGLWSPALLLDPNAEISSERYGGGALLGAGAGVLAAAAVSQWTEIDGPTAVEGGLAWAAATAVGAGVGLLVPDLDRRATVGLMEGAGLVGLTTGLLLADSLDYRGGDVALVPFGAALGGATGLTFATLVRGDDDSVQAGERIGGALLGAGTGAIGAAVVAQLTDLETTDVVETGVLTGMGGAIGLGLGLMLPDSGRPLHFGLMNAAGAAGLATGLALAPSTELSDHALANLWLGATIGAFVGGFTPVLYNGPDISNVPGMQVGGGLLAGTATGLAGGLLVDQLMPIDGATRAHTAFGASLGALTGGGLGMLTSTDDRVAVALMQGLTLATAVGVGATATHFDYGADDLALGAAYVGYLSWHSVGLTLLLDGSDRQAAGIAMSTAGLGALTGIYLTPYLDLDLADTLMLLAGNVWGTWIGGWGGVLLRERLDTDFDGRRSAGYTLLTTVVGSDVGVALASLLVSQVVDIEPTRFAVINLCGLGGMMLGMLGAGFAKDDPLKGGNVIGSLSGLVIGAVATSFFDWDRGPTWDELLSRQVDTTKSPSPSHNAKVIDIESWAPSAQVEPTPEGEPRYMFGVTGTWH